MRRHARIVTLVIAGLVAVNGLVAPAVHASNASQGSDPPDARSEPAAVAGPFDRGKPSNAVISTDQVHVRVRAGTFQNAQAARSSALATGGINPTADTTIDVYPGRVTTVAGPANLASTRGATVIGNDVFVADVEGVSPNLTPKIQRVAPGGQVTTLATGGGCSGLSSDMGSIDTDGTDIYVANGYPCRNLAKVTPAGNVSIVAAHPNSGWWESVVVGPDGYLYASRCCNVGVDRIDPTTGAVTVGYIQSLTVNGATRTISNVNGLAADSQNLWISAAITSIDNHIGLLRVSFANPSSGTFYYSTSASLVGGGQLASAGNYLYAPAGGQDGVVQFDKTTGAIGTAVGATASNGNSGYADGEFSAALFDTVKGVASDGNDAVYVSDSGNDRIRKVRFVPLLGQELGSGVSSVAARPNLYVGDPVDTNPASGAFIWSETDIQMPSIGVPLEFARYYSSRSTHVGRFGLGWSDSFDASLMEINGGARAWLPGGQVLSFNSVGGVLEPERGIFARLAKVGANYELTTTDGSVYVFEPTPNLPYPGRFRLLSIRDRHANQVTLSYNGENLTVSQGTRSITLTASTSGFTLSTSDGRTVTYAAPNVYGAGSPRAQVTSVTDARGKIWRYEYTGAQLSGIRDPSNAYVVQNSYDAEGRVSTQQDGNLPASAYFYRDPTKCDPSSIECTVVQDGRGWSWEYYYWTDVNGIGTGELQEAIDPDGNTVWYRNYTSQHLAQEVMDERGNIWQYRYDAPTGQVTFVRSPLTPGTNWYHQYTYNSYGQMLTSTDDRGKASTNVFDNTTGTLTCQYPAGANSCASDRAVTYTYWPSGLVKTMTSAVNGGTSQRGITSYDYDAAGRVTKITAPAPAASGTSVTTYAYPTSYTAGTLSVSMVTPQGNAKNCGTNCAAYTWVTQYDATGNVLKVTDPLGRYTQSTFDDANRLETQRDARGFIATYHYNAGSARVQYVEAPNITGTPAITRYEYNGTGNLSCVILPNNTSGSTCASTNTDGHKVQYTYTGNGRPDTTTDPLGRVWDFDYSNWTTQGKVIEGLPGSGTITSSYDAEGRLTGTDYSSANTNDVTLDYSAWLSLGKVSMADGMGAAVTSTFDDRGLLTSVQRGSASGFAYDYFADGSLKTRSYPGTPQVSTAYTFFPDGSLANVAAGGGTTTFAYDVANAKVTKTLPGNVVATASFNTAGQLTSLTNKKGSTTYSSYTITPDNAGNPTTIVANTRNASTAKNATETINYVYDNAGRLSAVCYVGSATNCPNTGASTTGASWTYDAAGNRTKKVVSGTSPSTTFYGYDGANALCWSGPNTGTQNSGAVCPTAPAGATTYGYNNRGDLTSVTPPGAGTPTTYTYDQADRLTQITNGSTIDTYTYDGLGNRFNSVRGSTTTTYQWDLNASLPLLASDSDGTSATTRTYVYGQGLLQEKVGSTWYGYTKDPQGSVANITDAAGALKATYIYDPWGTNRSATTATGAPTNLMRFQSQYRDASANYNLRARIYDPGIGVFLSRDPATSLPGYGFAAGNPMVYADPSGRSVLDWVNEHLNPAYAYLNNCWGTDGTQSLGEWATGCTVASTALVATAVTFAKPTVSVGRSIRARLSAGAADEASSIVPYDPEWASRQLAGQNTVGSSGYATTPAGRTLSAHAAERTFIGGPGRPPIDPGLIDDILSQGTKVSFDSLRDTIRVSAPNLCGRCFVVVDAGTAQHIVTVMVPK